MTSHHTSDAAAVLCSRSVTDAKGGWLADEVMGRPAFFQEAGAGQRKPACFRARLRDDFAMPLPTEPVILSAEQIAEVNQKLSNMRHDVNNNLSLMMAAAELARRRPESAERMWKTLTDQPHKIADCVTEFSRELEAMLKITRP